MSQPSVAVLIPIYQLSMTPQEQYSFQQGIKVLAKYPIIIIKPQSLDVGVIQKQFSQITTVSFADDYFKDIEGYNRLLTSTHFYKQFLAYDFVLIYQLDALVFRDELLDWCNKNYDYIGAPHLPTQLQKPIFNTKKTMLNGGFSLRKVKPCLRLIEWYSAAFGQWPGNEDMLFSLHATRLVLFRWLMRLPTCQEALLFAFEQTPKQAFMIVNSHLPFGCHAWQKYDPDFWNTQVPLLGIPNGST
jgi:Protein of unknown function (DUF5672)